MSAAMDELDLALGLGPAKAKLPRTLQRSGYETVKQIGQGGFAQAHLIHNAQRRQNFVAKHVNLLLVSPGQRDEARNEVAILRQLSHPNIVRLIDTCEDQAQLYMILEHAECGDLNKHLASQKRMGTRLSEEQILSLFAQTCLAVKHMHDRMLVHGDIKSSNIFLSQSYSVVKLGDFGLASKPVESPAEYAPHRSPTRSSAPGGCGLGLDDDAEAEADYDYARRPYAIKRASTPSSMVVAGTPSHFSPELCYGGSYDRKSDAWALGVLLFELMTNEVPFPGYDVQRVMEKICKGDVPPLPRGHGYSMELVGLLSSLLRKQPKLRPEVADILRLPLMLKSMPGVVALHQKMAAAALVTPPRAAAPRNTAASIRPGGW